jgi:hypothetical protein
VSCSGAGDSNSASNGFQLPSHQEDLKTSPVVVVSKTEVLLDGVRVARVVRPRPNDMEWKIAPLYDALVAKLQASGGQTVPIIVKADADTQLWLVNRVLKTAYATGYGNIMFADVKPDNSARP